MQLATRTLLNPAAAQWDKIPAEELALGATPLQGQPSHYVRTAWAGRPVGAVWFGFLDDESGPVHKLVKKWQVALPLHPSPTSFTFRLWGRRF